jgi:ParB family chromosome partitioning protein
VARKERGLGRGLEALLSPTGEDNQTAELAIEQIVPRSDQPRRTFDQKSLQELAESIKEHGILQPVLVRPRGIGYELIAGERRWRAAQIAGLQTIPGIIREMDDMEVDEASLIENLQRDDLSVLEEAQAYKNMLEKHNYTQEALAQRIGKSRAHIANVIRILGSGNSIADGGQKKPERRACQGSAGIGQSPRADI